MKCPKCKCETEEEKEMHCYANIGSPCPEYSEWNTGDAFCCEQHPDKPFPHFKEMFVACEGPGIPDHQGRVTIAWLKEGLKNIMLHNSSYCQMGHGKMAESILNGDVTHF